MQLLLKVNSFPTYARRAEALAWYLSTTYRVMRLVCPIVLHVVEQENDDDTRVLDNDVYLWYNMAMDTIKGVER